ncbi:hypothetical protein SPHV1_2170018 [Novosphingobium sp. KN65.2]|nr:hypothetical protein SPHV1_2170018 [Novosphingobium sp. KN65.2]
MVDQLRWLVVKELLVGG